jgi:hypothetical protein
LLLDRGELKDWFNSSEIWINNMCVLTSRTPRGILPIYKKEGRRFAALFGFRDTEEFEANQLSRALVFTA